MTFRRAAPGVLVRFHETFVESQVQKLHEMDVSTCFLRLMPQKGLAFCRWSLISDPCRIPGGNGKIRQTL